MAVLKYRGREHALASGTVPNTSRRRQQAHFNCWTNKLATVRSKCRCLIELDRSVFSLLRPVGVARTAKAEVGETVGYKGGSAEDSDDAR